MQLLVHQGPFAKQHNLQGQLDSYVRLSFSSLVAGTMPWWPKPDAVHTCWAAADSTEAALPWYGTLSVGKCSVELDMKEETMETLLSYLEVGGQPILTCLLSRVQACWDLS